MTLWSTILLGINWQFPASGGLRSALHGQGTMTNLHTCPPLDLWGFL